MRPLQDAQVLLLALAHVVRDRFQPGCRRSIAAMVEDTSCFLESPARGFDLGGIHASQLAPADVTAHSGARGTGFQSPC